MTINSHWLAHSLMISSILIQYLLLRSIWLIQGTVNGASPPVKSGLGNNTNDCVISGSSSEDSLTAVLKYADLFFSK